MLHITNVKPIKAWLYSCICLAVLVIPLGSGAASKEQEGRCKVRGRVLGIASAEKEGEIAKSSAIEIKLKVLGADGGGSGGCDSLFLPNTEAIVIALKPNAKSAKSASSGFYSLAIESEIEFVASLSGKTLIANNLSVKKGNSESKTLKTLVYVQKPEKQGLISRIWHGLLSLFKI